MKNMWIDELENPQAIRNIFPNCPDLTGVELMTVSIDRDGPTVVVNIGVNELPPQIPPKWEGEKANALVIKLQLLAVTAVSIERWSTVNVVDIALRREGPESIVFRAVGSTTSIECKARFIRVLSLSPYQREQMSAN
jgi:Immunity protein 50